MNTTAEIPSIPTSVLPMPHAPSTLEEAGLSLDLVLQLALKTMHFAGDLTGAQLGQRLGLNFSVIEPAIDALKVARHVEIIGGGMVGRAAYRYRISDAGRARAALFLETNRYVGVAPVPFDQYRRYMVAFSQAVPRIAAVPAGEPQEPGRGDQHPDRGDRPDRGAGGEPAAWRAHRPE